MCFAIFVPDHRSNDLESLRPLGCDRLFDRNAQAQWADCFDGPQGYGKLIWPEDRTAVTNYNPELQTWVDCGGFWYGYWNESKPTPERLERRRMVDGLPVVLLDGNSWVIPMVPYFPKVLKWNAAEQSQYETPFAEHAKFLERVDEIFVEQLSDAAQAQREAGGMLMIPDGLSFCAEALSINYRVNAAIVSALELVGHFEAAEIIKVVTCITMAEQLAELKKNSLAGTKS